MSQPSTRCWITSIRLTVFALPHKAGADIENIRVSNTVSHDTEYVRQRLNDLPSTSEVSLVYWSKITHFYHQLPKPLKSICVFWSSPKPGGPGRSDRGSAPLSARGYKQLWFEKTKRSSTSSICNTCYSLSSRCCYYLQHQR